MTLGDFIVGIEEAKAIEQVREFISRELPPHTQKIPYEEGPVALRSLVEIAELLGVENDTVRADALRMMPMSFRTRLAVHVESIRDAVAPEPTCLPIHPIHTPRFNPQSASA
jgi:hypothetical protein